MPSQKWLNFGELGTSQGLSFTRGDGSQWISAALLFLRERVCGAPQGVHGVSILHLCCRELDYTSTHGSVGFPGVASGKEPARQCRRPKKCAFDSWVGKIPWRRSWQPTSAFLPGEAHGQKSLAGCSSEGCRVRRWRVTEATSHGRTYESTGLSIFIPQTLK